MKNGNLIAISDNAGIVQINNMNSGNILMSLSDKKNKQLVSVIHYVEVSKIFQVYLVAGCIDGTVIFFLVPTIDNSKDN